MGENPHRDDAHHGTDCAKYDAVETGYPIWKSQARRFEHQHRQDEAANLKTTFDVGKGEAGQERCREECQSCVDAPYDARGFSGLSMWSGAVVCPAS